MRLLKVRYASGDELLEHVSAAQFSDGRGIFFPTREALPVGEQILVELRFPGLANPMVFRGTVAWRRAGKHRAKLRAGVGIGFQAAEGRRWSFLIAVAKGEIVEMITRRHRRIPVNLTANWRVACDREVHQTILEDIGPGGAFLRTTELLPPGTEVVLDVQPPGSVRPLEIMGRVVWARHSDGMEGLGVEFKSRDSGGTRRLKELVRRLELLEAENIYDPNVETA